MSDALDHVATEAGSHTVKESRDEEINVFLFLPSTTSQCSTKDGGDEPPRVPRFKVAMLGASGVGKTALTCQFTTSEYICAYDTSLVGKRNSRREMGWKLLRRTWFIPHPPPPLCNARLVGYCRSQATCRVTCHLVGYNISIRLKVGMKGKREKPFAPFFPINTTSSLWHDKIGMDCVLFYFLSGRFYWNICANQSVETEKVEL
ncbi:unnamed protein product [Timema podura]|uniref:Uncharacterized protein n=1 Tax=Timema podura TaxID=61482 RepID=A0ABN7NLW6_TIMPD|nr:unnamed protein product [Timema podura]